jgi:hypothetical protein
MVLATDMANHFKLLGDMKAKIISNEEINKDKDKHTIKEENENICDNNSFMKVYMSNHKDSNKFEIQQDLINFVLHAVDIGHAAKPFELEVKWAELVTAEFLNQGDIEKKNGLQISFLCDRNTSNVPASQVGFIAGMVLPTFKLLNVMMPKMKHYATLISEAQEEWSKIKKEKEKLENTKKEEKDKVEN